MIETMSQLSTSLLERLRLPTPWVEADARAIVAELEHCSTSVMAFARAHELPAKRLYYWRTRIHELGPSNEPGLSFAPVVVTGLGGGPALTMRIGALELDVHEPNKLEPSWLAGLLEAVAKEAG